MLPGTTLRDLVARLRLVCVYGLAMTLVASVLTLVPSLGGVPERSARADHVAGTGGDLGEFHPLTASRGLDTRNGTGVCAPSPCSAVGPGATLTWTVGGRNGVPTSGVSAVALNIAVTEATASSYLTVFPFGTSRPLASSINFNAGDTVSNAVTTMVSADGKVNIFNAAGSVAVIGDIAGYYMKAGAAPGDRFVPITPVRVLDTRYPTGTCDGTCAALAPGGTLTVKIAGLYGIPASGVSAVKATVVATQPSAASNLTVYPAGTAHPGTSNLTFAAGQTIANLATSRLSGDGKLTIYNATGYVHVIVDVSGYYQKTGKLYRPLQPARILDTRAGSRTGVCGLNTCLPPGSDGAPNPMTLNVAGQGGVPSGASAVLMNVTVTGATAASYLTIWPSDATQPTTSVLNFVAGQTIGVLVAVKLSASGQVKIYNGAGSAEVIADIVGWFGDAPAVAPPKYLPSTLVAQHSNKCLDVDQVSLDNGARVVQYDCTGGKNQSWTLTWAGNSTGPPQFTVRAQHSGKCLDAVGSGTADGTPLQQWDCFLGYGGNQSFYPVRVNGTEPAGVFELKGVQSGKCLDVPASTTANSAGITLYTCTGTSNQRFRMRTYGPAGEVSSFGFAQFQISDTAELKVNTQTGNLLFKETDLDAPGVGLPLSIMRYYNSMPEPLGRGRNSAMGNNWSLNYGADIHKELVRDAGLTSARIRMPSGYSAFFANNGTATLAPPMGMRGAQMGAALTSALTSAESRSVMEFGQSGMLTAVRDRFGNRITTQYAPNDQTLSITDTAGRRVSFGYSSSDYLTGRVRTITDWAGRQAKYTYDEKDNLWMSTDLAGKTTRYGYDAQNRLSSVTNARGHTTSIGYDANGRVSLVHQAPNTYSSGFTYNKGRNNCSFNGLNSGVPEPALPSTVLDSTDLSAPDLPGDALSSFCHDTEGRMIRTIGRNGAVTQQTFGSDSEKTQFGWGDGSTINEFDVSKRVKKRTGSTGANVRYDYTDTANPYIPTSETDAQGNTTSLSYVNAQLTAATDALGNAERFTYNPNSTISTSTDRRGNQTTYRYNTLGQLTSMTSPASGTTNVTYDAVGRQRTVTDAKGQQTTATYDNLNRLTQLAYSDGSTVSYTYDGNGNMLTQSDALGTTTYTYDEQDRLKTERLPHGKLLAYTYDARGNLTSFADGADVTKYTYTPGDLLETVTDPSGAVTTVFHFHGQNSNLTPSDVPTFQSQPAQIKYPNGTSVYNVVDKADRVVRTTVYRTVDGSKLADPSASMMDLRYSYSRNGTDTSLLQSMTDAKNGDVTTYRYDARNRLIGATKESSAGAVLSNYAYRYDAAGNRLPDYQALVARHSGKCVDVADNSDRNGANVQQWSCHGGSAQNFALQEQPGGYYLLVNERSGKCLDVAGFSTLDGGNVQQYKCNGTDNQLFRLTLGEYYTFANKGSGKCLDVTGVSSADGANIQQWTCSSSTNQQFALRATQPARTYNAGNQIATEGASTFVYDANGNNTSGERLTSNGPNVAMTYNAKNQMTSMTGMGNPSYMGAGQSLLRGVGSTVFENSSELGLTRMGNDTFTRAPGGKLVSMSTGAGKHYYVHDPRGNVIATLNGAGDISSTYTYDPYGNTVGTTGSAISPFRFQSQLLINPTYGIYKIGERYYDSTRGRWTQADPMDAENRYVYADADPINRNDPTGLSVFGTLSALGGWLYEHARNPCNWPTAILPPLLWGYSGIAPGTGNTAADSVVYGISGYLIGSAFAHWCNKFKDGGPRGGGRGRGPKAGPKSPGGPSASPGALDVDSFKRPPPGSNSAAKVLEGALKATAMASLAVGVLIGHCT